MDKNPRIEQAVVVEMIKGNVGTKQCEMGFSEFDFLPHDEFTSLRAFGAQQGYTGTQFGRYVARVPSNY